MAVRVKLDSLTEEQKKIIRERLYFQPKKTNFAVNRFASAVEKDPVLFYWIDKPNNEIVLPYTFANVLLGKHINSSLTYPLSKFVFTGQLRDYQVPIAEEAMKQLMATGTTLLNLGTGLGKSALSAYLASKLDGMTLVLTNRETIQKGWYETFADNTNAGVWLVDSKMRIPEKCNVILTMDGRFEKIPLEIRKMIAVFVIDEMHLFMTASQVPVLLGVCPKYVIACTATPTRTDNMERMWHSIGGTHCVEVKNTKKFTVYKFMTGIVTELEKNKMGTVDFSKLTASLANNPLRNAFIIDLIEKNKSHKIMLLSWSKAHVTLLYDVLSSRGVKVDYLSGKKSTYVDSQVLLGTISKVSTGFDSKNVATDFDGMAISMLILAGSTKSFNLHQQSIGRAFRSDNPTIIDVVDSDKISLSHWNSRRKNYEEMNCDIFEVKMHKRDTMNNIETETNSEITEESIQNMHQNRIDTYNAKISSNIKQK
jgi:superfamily II DNA or RNA helicase